MTERSGPPISVLLVDDHQLVRAGFRLVLESVPDIRVVGEAADGRAAIEAVHLLRPQVTLLDIQMPVMGGLDALPRLTETRVVVLTTFENDEYLYEGLRLGASGFLLKNSTPERLIDAVRVVAAGGALLDPQVTRRVIERFAGGRSSGQGAKLLSRLSEREREVLMLIAAGLSNLEIAERLFVSDETVKSHVSSVLRKLELRDRVQAAVFAHETGAVLQDTTQDN